MIYRIGTEFRQVSVRLRSKISSFFDFYYDNISKEIKNVENLERFFCEFMFNDDIGLKHILENGKNPENFGYVKYHDYYVLQGLNHIFNRVLDDIPKNIQTSQKLSDELYGLLKNKNEKRE